MRVICPGAGYFQQRLRIYDLQKMDAEPATVRDVPDKIRCAAWHQEDTLLLTSYTDQPGIGCAHLIYFKCTLNWTLMVYVASNRMKQEILSSAGWLSSPEILNCMVQCVGHQNRWSGKDT